MWLFFKTTKFPAFIALKKVEIEPGRLFGFEKWLTSSPEGSEIHSRMFVRVCLLVLLVSN